MQRLKANSTTEQEEKQLGGREKAREIYVGIRRKLKRQTKESYEGGLGITEDMEEGPAKKEQLDSRRRSLHQKQKGSE